MTTAADCPPRPSKKPSSRRHLEPVAEQVIETTWDGANPHPGVSSPIRCPRCGKSGALADRVGVRIYGGHDDPSGCGWTAARTVRS